MATPNYVLKDDHVATCGHVRTAYSALNTAKKDKGTFDSKVQHSTANSSIDCSDANQIDIKVNGGIRGYFFQPVG